MRVRGTIDRPPRTTQSQEASAADRPYPSRSSPDIVQRSGSSTADSDEEDAGGKPPQRITHKTTSTQATPESEGPDWASYDTKRALRILSQESDPEARKRILRKLHC